ncbi:MAG: hypothetical protein JWQ20_1331 [Conexibacter sp.]|nr:hypothetical protein [Conexibacter sp.]
MHAKVSDYSDVTGVAGDAGAPTRIYQPRENATDGILAQRIDYDALARVESLWTVGNVNATPAFAMHTSYTRLRNGWIDISEEPQHAELRRLRPGELRRRRASASTRPSNQQQRQERRPTRSSTESMAVGRLPMAIRGVRDPATLENPCCELGLQDVKSGGEFVTKARVNRRRSSE